jgi:hypothetical protein
MDAIETAAVEAAPGWTSFDPVLEEVFEPEPGEEPEADPEHRTSARSCEIFRNLLMTELLSCAHGVITCSHDCASTVQGGSFRQSQTSEAGVVYDDV